jgi:hypothetical protein
VTQDDATVGTLSREGHNPFVGPRSLGRGDPIYGRTREIGDLANLLVAERIVLLYSPSGAGKTSLLEAGLSPELARRDFHVFPTIRVGFEPPDITGRDARNRYVLSVLTSVEEGRPAETRIAASELATITLDEYFDRLVADTPEGRDPCFVFDQFEELFTLDPTDHAAKADFLTELGIALRDRGRWSLFSMREDLIAQLDPYLALVPNRFAIRYRLDLLGPDAATVAIRRTAADAGVDFTQEAAALLIDDLRRVQVQRAGVTTFEAGPSIEAVQLQVACRQLWETLDRAATEIRADDVAALGSVDNALGDFYASQVHGVAQRTGANEREIRTWFDEALITENGFRTQVLRGPQTNGAAVVRELENAHLIRTERRRGTEWYELAHDRLIEPVRANNVTWGQHALGSLQREAQDWERRGRPATLLMTGPRLAEAEEWAQQHASEMLPVDRDFLHAGRAEQRRSDLERRATRWKLIAATTISALALAALALVGLLFFSARDGEQEARARERETERVSALAVDCAGGDNAACDGLFRTGTNEDLARTCGNSVEQPIPGGTCEEHATREAQKLRDGCADGNFADCDELFLSSEFESEAEEFGATCGGRTGAEGAGTCAETNGGENPLPSTFGDDPAFDELWSRCEAGDGTACDDLFLQSPSGSDYEEFGFTCGGRSDGSQETCVDVV